MEMDELLKRVAALDNFDLPILSPEFRAATIKKHSRLKRPAPTRENEINSSSRKNHRSDDGLEGTRSLTVEQRHALLEPLGHFNFEEFSRHYPTVCEADYRLSLAQAEERTVDNDSDECRECGESEADSDECTELFESASEADSDELTGLNSMEPERELVGEFEWNVLKRMESDYTEDSPNFLDSLAKCTHEEDRIRSGKSHENLINGRIEHRADTFFHRKAFDEIFGESLRRASLEDRFISDKMAQLEPLITTRSFTELHVALVEFLYKLMMEMDRLYVSMCSIYSRCRSQATLTDITSDVRRIRELKMEQPGITIKDILNTYKVSDKAPECINRFNVSGDVVREAMRRIGADNYGPRADFAEIINSVIPENILTETDARTAVRNDSSVASSINLSNLSSEQIEDLQGAIKRLIQNKLKK